jgi:thiol-disulfide isomerase/thioredoxin
MRKIGRSLYWIYLNGIEQERTMTFEALQEIIRSEMGVLLYFSGENCTVCHALRPKFKELFDTQFPLIRQIYLDAHENPEISAHFQVFSVPTMIVFLDGREFVREGRAVSLHKLTEQLKRPYGMMTE